MTRNWLWNWPIPYGIQLETSVGFRCPISDGRFQWICDYLFGIAETGYTEPDAKLPHVERQFDAEIATHRPTHSGTKCKNPAPRGSGSQADAIDSDPSHATGRRCFG